MVGFLWESLEAMNDVASSVDSKDILPPFDPDRCDKDPLIAFRVMSHWFVTKARLHVIAALRANEFNNIHSLAVQMRPVLECAGQIVSVSNSLFGESPRAKKKLAQYLDADYYQTVKRLSKGKIDHDKLLEEISSADPMREEPLRRTKAFKESEKVQDIKFGCSWYSHLSQSFFHSDLPALKNHSYYGGVRSCNTMYDEYAFVALLEYLVNQVLVMLMHAALYSVDTPQGDERFKKTVDLLGRKRAAVDQYEKALMSMTRRSDVAQQTG